MSLHRPTSKRKQLIARWGLLALRLWGELLCRLVTTFSPSTLGFFPTLSPWWNLDWHFYFYPPPLEGLNIFHIPWSSEPQGNFLCHFSPPWIQFCWRKEWSFPCWYATLKLSYTILEFLVWLGYQLSEHNKITGYHQQKMNGRFLDHTGRGSIP